MITPRRVALGLCVLTLAAGCAASHGTSNAAKTTTSSPSTVDPDLVPNAIPYVVDARIGLPNGWLVEVTKVHRPYAAPGLPTLSSGEQYVAVDITMQNQGDTTYRVNAASIFTMVDRASKVHDVVRQAGATNRIDGRYPPGTTQSGRLVFVVPVGSHLAMALDGPQIGTQRSIWTIDPPT